MITQRSLPFVARVGLLVGLLSLTGPGLGAADSPGTAVPRALQAPGIENFFQVTDRLFSGGQPEGDAAFAALRDLGVRTILSVDGTPPDVERAARYGFRYVHLPHGYDGIPSNTVARLIRAARTVDGPLFVHCHHGRHRGVAAVGVICQGTAGWSTNQALHWLEQAGTSRDYPGLFRANLEFHPPPPAELERIPTNFPARVEATKLVDAMVRIDGLWDRLKKGTTPSGPGPAAAPNGTASEAAVLLREAFRELLRDATLRERPVGFQDLLQRAAAAADEAGVPGGGGASSDSVARLDAACKDCHRRYRN